MGKQAMLNAQLFKLAISVDKYGSNDLGEF
jgi:hypothetical protein